MSNKNTPKTGGHTYVRGFIALSPEELAASINEFMSNKIIVSDIQFFQNTAMVFWAFITYEIAEE